VEFKTCYQRFHAKVCSSYIIKIVRNTLPKYFGISSNIKKRRSEMKVLKKINLKQCQWTPETTFQLLTSDTELASTAPAMLRGAREAIERSFAFIGVHVHRC
jgi:hypothetical protein